MVEGISGRPLGLSGSFVRPDANTERAKMLGQTPNSEATTGAGQPPVRAELSELAQSARSAAAAPVDTAKVAALKAAIADGSYKVDPDGIAARMIELDLGIAQ
jgi:negative regulator of flagellin synthesis FlgM